jgi:murein DD-endopeptidase MepM/ murein hydrolase activator NlpD
LVANLNFRQRIAGFYERLFSDRELFVRTDGRVRYVQLSRRQQTTVALALVLAVAWVVYASYGVVLHNRIVAGKEGQIAERQLAYLDLLSEVSEYHDQFTRITRNLEDNQTYLLSLLGRGGLDAEELADVEWQLKQSQTERARVAIARDGLRERLAAFGPELEDMAEGRAALESKLAEVTTNFSPAESDPAEVAAARDLLRRRVEEMNTSLAEVTTENGELKATVADLGQQLERSKAARENLVDAKSALSWAVARLEQHLSQAQTREALLGTQIATLEDSLGDASGRGDSLARERDDLQSRIVGLEQRLVDMRDTQQTLVSRLSERTTLSIDTFEQTVAMTGLDVNRLLSGGRSEDLTEDQGGPFIPGDYVVEDDPLHSLQASIAMLDLQMDRWEGLQKVVRTLPLTAPLDQFRITSAFGPRRDPVNRRKSSHYGIDLAAPMRTPILSTAPGKVVFAGWKGRYGRVVVIDHGHGIRTRYAHLRKILVRVGQEVGHREKIALLGSSGRSTGPHVHYEVQVHGKPVDPMKFLKAGKYVFKS